MPMRITDDLANMLKKYNPLYVVDAPGGGGKIPLMPNYLLSHSGKRYVIRNYEGVVTTYTQPSNIFSECWCELCKNNEYGPLDGVVKLLNGEKLATGAVVGNTVL